MMKVCSLLAMSAEQESSQGVADDVASNVKRQATKYWRRRVAIVAKILSTMLDVLCGLQPSLTPKLQIPSTAEGDVDETLHNLEP